MRIVSVLRADYLLAFPHVGVNLESILLTHRESLVLEWVCADASGRHSSREAYCRVMMMVVEIVTINRDASSLACAPPMGGLTAFILALWQMSPAPR